VSNVSISNLYTNGVNFTGLIQTLVAMQQQPVTQLTQQMGVISTQQNAWQTVNTELAQLGSDASALTQSATWSQAQATSSNQSVMSAAVDSSATPGTYNISVSQLAQSEVDVSNIQSSSTSALGITGSFSINGSATILLSSSMTLEDIAAAINGTTGTGVTASVVSNRLILQATATDQAIAYTQTSGTPLTTLGVVTGTGTNNVIQNAAPLQYSFNYTNSATSQTTSVTETQSTNTDTSTLPGVSMNFTSTGSTTLTVSPNVQAMAASVQQMVQDYNALVKSMNGYTGQGGVLQGDVGMNTLGTQLAQVVTTQVPSLAGQPYQDLQDIGVTVNGDGTLSVNQSQLTSALQANPTDVQQIFTDSANGIATQFQNLSQQYTTPTTGVIAGINNSYTQEISADNQEVTALQQQITVYQQQLQAEFLAAQQAIAKLDGTSSFISQVGAATTPVAAQSTSGTGGSSPTTSSTTTGG
jgi:flagellar hook-associated protein 2